MCSRCGVCKVAYSLETRWSPCPIYEVTGWDSDYARGKMLIAKAIIDREYSYQPEFVNESLFKCTTCGYCEWYCKTTCGYFAELMETMREDAINLGLAPLPPHKRFQDSIVKNHNPYGEPHKKRKDWLPTKVPENADIIYFVGCTTPYRRPEIAIATYNILKAADIDFGVMSDEWCCGSPAFRAGAKKIALELVKHNVEAIRNIGAKKVVTACAGCYRTLKIDYPKYVGAMMDFEVIHITDLILELIAKGKLKLEGRVKQRVTYHDPCHLTRHLNLQGLVTLENFEIPRKVLTSVPGVELVEMGLNRGSAFCCGAGGGVKSGYPDVALKAAKLRVTMAEETDAEALVSACPFCKTNLLDAAVAKDSKLKVCDVTEIVAETLE